MTSLSTLLGKFYDTSLAPIFIFDRHGAILSMNPAAEAINPAFSLEQIKMNPSDDFCLICRGYTSTEEIMSCVNCYLSNPLANFTSFQVYIDTKDKGTVPYSASMQTIDHAAGIRMLLLQDLTNQLVTQETVYRNSMIKSTIKAQEDERKRISRELHDSVAQELISSLVDLRLLKYLNVQDEVLNKVHHTEATLNRLLEQIRNLSVELRPASLDDLGLEAAFRSHFKWVEKSYGVQVEFLAQLNGTRYNSEIETVVYRICQEAVLNSVKYAEVDEVKVHLFQSENHLELIVQDFGLGFQLNNMDSKGTGLGLYGMRERTELVQGVLSIVSGLGEGTKIHLQIPIKKQQRMASTSPEGGIMT